MGSPIKKSKHLLNLINCGFSSSKNHFLFCERGAHRSRAICFQSFTGFCTKFFKSFQESSSLNPSPLLRLNCDSLFYGTVTPLMPIARPACKKKQRRIPGGDHTDHPERFVSCEIEHSGFIRRNECTFLTEELDFHYRYQY